MKTKTVKTNMGEMPMEDYLEIRAQQSGFDSYAEMVAEGYSIDIPETSENSAASGLTKYLEELKIDQIENDQKFYETEYTAIQTYCENSGYSITDEDMAEIRRRGLGCSYYNWKMVYVKDLWDDLGDVPMNPETEEIEQQWRHFPPGTFREDIWHWFEEEFDISVAEIITSSIKDLDTALQALYDAARNVLYRAPTEAKDNHWEDLFAECANIVNSFEMVGTSSGIVPCYKTNFDKKRKEA